MVNVIRPEDLFRSWKASSLGQPKVLLLLGAGASVSSGVPSGGQLIAEWRDTYDAGIVSDSDKVARQPWHNKPAEYGRLFEHIYRTAAARRDFIESILTEASPSWGYLYLTDLLRNRVFNTVLTTNFDDLVNEACYAFTHDVRPIICSHETSLGNFRLSSSRPKIIKLHGDFLFDSIRNTPEETSSLTQNIQEKFAALSSEYGLMVVGYAGQCDSVMSAIASLLNVQDSFPQGLYWCLRDPSKYPERLEPYLQDSRVQFVQVNSFDTLMATAHDVFCDMPPRIVESPNKLLSDRVARLLKTTDLPLANDGTSRKPAIQRDLEKLASWVTSPLSVSVKLPAGLAGYLKFHEGDFSNALQMLRRDVRSTPSVQSAILFFECLRHCWDDAAFDEAKSMLERTASNPKTQVRFLNTFVLSLIHSKKLDCAEQICEIAETAYSGKPEFAMDLAFARLNKLQIVLHRGEQLTAEQLTAVSEIEAAHSIPQVVFGCKVLSGQYREAVEIVTQAPDAFSAATNDWPLILLMPIPERNRLKSLLGTGMRHYGRLDLTISGQLLAP